MIILLLLFSLVFCSESNVVYYNLLENHNRCGINGCSFNVTPAFPVSPLIDTNFFKKEIFPSYSYMYLKFNIPKQQKQKTFFLEAFSTSNGLVITSNGDCYSIDTTDNIYYELRIYKNLRANDFIRLGFFGIPDDFIMEVKLDFFFNTLNFNAIVLDNKNSLYKSSFPSYQEISYNTNKNRKEQNDRKNSAIETCQTIMKSLFNKYLNISSFIGDAYYSYSIVPINPLVITTVSFAVGRIMDVQIFLHPESVILSETIIREGKVFEYKDGLDYLEGSTLISNDVLKMVESYNKKITDTIIGLKLKKDYTLIISTNKDINYILYTLRTYTDKSKQIYYETSFITGLTNYKVKELIINSRSLSQLIFYIPNIFNCFSENGISIKNKIEYIMKGISLFKGILDLTNFNPIATKNEVSLLIKNTDWAKVGGTLLDMDKDEKGIYHARFDCWQQCVGYSKFYDSMFDLFTDMRYNNNGTFVYNKQNYVLWAWKGDYLNLGAGAELGIYYGGKDINSFWKIDKSLAMPMTLTLKHKTKGIIVDNWKNTTWWITAFNPNITDIYANDLTAYFTVKFLNDEMFKEFSKVEREGWSFNNKTKIASLVL